MNLKTDYELLEVYHILVSMETAFKNFRKNNVSYERGSFEPYIRMHPDSLKDMEDKLRLCQRNILKNMVDNESMTYDRFLKELKKILSGME